MSPWQRRWLAVGLIIFALILTVGTAVAQTDNQLTLTLNRDFGAGFGSNIQGTFSFRVSGPEDLTSVTFYIDDEIVGEDSEAPFRLQFKTGDFPLGVRTLHAVGLSQDGQSLTSNSIQRNFISSSSAIRTALYTIIPIILLVVGGGLLSSWIANSGRKSSGKSVTNVHGSFGGTICPKCNKPFAMHIWGLNIVVGKYDRCPHCKKWSVVRRVNSDLLDASAEAMAQAESAAEKLNPINDSDDDLRKRLDDSKFDS